MNKQELFLQANPDIFRMLQNDISLKNICSCEELRIQNLDSVSLPCLYNNNEIRYVMNDFSILNYMKVFLYMVVNNKVNLQLVYKNCCCTQSDVDDLQKIVQQSFKIAQAKYIEYLSGILGIEVRTQYVTNGYNVVEIKLDITYIEHYSGAIKDTFKFLKVCNYIKYQLIKGKKIRKSMSEVEIARVLYNWVVLHVKYDTTFQGYSFTGYSATIYGYAVCQGYTALYNALCKLFHLNIVGMSGVTRNKYSIKEENHIWSFALLDNRNVYIDVTWGSPKFEGEKELLNYGLDVNEFCDFTYFDIPYNKLIKDHNWDKAIYS